MCHEGEHVKREAVEGEQITSASSSSAASFGGGLRNRSSASETSSRAPSPESALKIAVSAREPLLRSGLAAAGADQL
jgi:hypothetical protein